MANTLELGNGKWATGKDTVLAFNDENNNFKPLPFSFSRASSATVVNKDGLIETVGSGEPRIDFKDNTKGALLLEPQRRNYVQYSNDASQWSSVVSNGTVTKTAGYAISPDGTQNATRLEASVSGGGYALISLANTTSFSGDYTSTVYVKSNTENNQDIVFYGRNTDYSKHTVTSEWTRIQFKGSSTSGQTNYAYIGISTGIRAEDNPIDILVWGGQLEQGSYATSYIPTSGSAVTRVADSSSQTVPDGVIGQTEGTVYAEIDFANTSGVAGAWSISNGSSANRITMNTTNLSSTQFTLSVAQNYNSGSTKLASANVLFSDKHKVAIKYSGTTLKLFVDGQLADSVSTDGFGNYTNFYVGGNQVGVGGDARKFIQADLYNTALTDQELIALTQ
jgi:hypothetical protein